MAEQQSHGGEQKLWTGGPTQWIGFKTYCMHVLICVVILALFIGLYYALRDQSWAKYICLGNLLLVIPIAVMVWKWLDLKARRYEMTSERLKITEGILSTTTEAVELYRVKDFSIIRPFWLRLVGKGHIKLLTSDQSMPEVHLDGLNDVDGTYETLRKYVEQARDRKRVRQVDGFEDNDSHELAPDAEM